MAGKTSGDAHGEYPVLVGRAGGQTLTGGTAASESLTLRATAHATDGTIIFQTDTNTTRMTLLGSANTLQGNAGLTIQGGAAAGNDLTLSSTSHGTKGDINVGESGCNIGFYGTTAAAQPSAYTQTYSTADKTHANLTATTRLVGTLGGAADGSMETVGATNGADVSGAIMNNFQELFVQGNALLVDLTDLKQLVNSVIDDLQTLGL